MAVFSTIPSTTVPLCNTVAYNTLVETAIDAFNDSGTKHAAFEEKEIQRAQRPMRLVKVGKDGHNKVCILSNCEYAMFLFLNTPLDASLLCLNNWLCSQCR